MKTKNIALWATVILLLTGMWACRSSRVAEQTPEGSQPVAGAPLKDVYTRLTSTYGEWTDLSVPVKLQLKQPKSFSVSGSLKMVRGKSVSISARMLGFEVGSLYIDNDSVLIVAKAADAYVCESMRGLRERYGVTLDDIQSFILGRLFSPGKGQATAGEAKAFAFSRGEGSTVEMVPSKGNAGVTMTFSVDDADPAVPVLTALTVTAANFPPVDCRYELPCQSVVGNCAGLLALKASFGGKNLDASLNMTMSKASWNGGLDLSKPSTKRYRRISAADALKILTKF